MRTSRLLILASLPLVLAGCKRETAAEKEERAAEKAAETGAPATVPAPPPETGAAPAVTAVVLEPLNNSGAGGTADISESAGKTQLVTNLTGAPPGQREGQIHTGTCQNVGPAVEQLQPVTVATTGMGTSTTAVTMPMATVMDGKHVVVYHGEGGQPIACGHIPARQM